MDSNTQHLTSFYEGWETYQGALTATIAPLTEAQLMLRAAPHLRPLKILAGHIISARAWWFHGIMHEGGSDLEAFYKWDEDDGPALTASDLVRGLDVSWQLIQGCLQRWTPADLTTTFPRRDSTVTRQWVIWHVIEHDLHHGGELMLTCGIHNLATAYY